MSNDDKTSDMINAAANLANAVPVYKDALQPVMQETGKALGTAGRAVNVAISPIRGLVWGAEKIEDWLTTSVGEKLGGIDESEIHSPDLGIAGPTIEALKFNGHKPELSEMFANLLASAMKKSTSNSVHPSFVHIISSMNSLDAQMFAAISSQPAIPIIEIHRKKTGEGGSTVVLKSYCPELYSVLIKEEADGDETMALYEACIEQLERLGLIKSRTDRELASEKNMSRYIELETSEKMNFFSELEEGKDRHSSVNGYIQLTTLGELFSNTVFS
jgi:hypothetical protein